MRAAAPRDDARGAAAFPWAEAMALGLGGLRLAPKDFWAMTPREFAGALTPVQATFAGPPTRGDLDALAARFPDERR